MTGKNGAPKKSKPTASLHVCLQRARKAVAFSLCLLMTFSLTACWSQRELNELAIVIGTSLDVGDQPDTLKLTAQVVKAAAMGNNSSSQNGGSGEKAYVNIDSTGESVLSIIRGMTREQSRKLYFAHNEVLIFSSDLAKLDMAEGLDAFTREYESRMSARILISRGRASEILEEEVVLEKVPALHIFSMMKNQTLNSETVVVTLRDFAIATLSGSTSPVAPIVVLYDSEGKKRAKLEGTAVFKDGKMVGELDKTQTRGLLWVTGKAQSGARTVETQWGQVILEIFHAKSRLKAAKTDGAVIRMELAIEVDGAIESNETTETMSGLDNIEMLKGLMEEAIRSEVASALAQARTLSADVFGFGEAIRRKYPEEWETMKGDWDAVFPQIELDVKVEVGLRSTGGLAGPVIPGGAQ